MKRETISMLVVLLLIIFISALFVSMIWNFLTALFLAAITAAMLYPLYQKLTDFFRGKKALASLTTILLFILIIIIPLGLLMGIITAQAIHVGKSVTPWIQEQIAQPENILSGMENLPFGDYLKEHQEEVLQKIGEIVGSISGFLLNSLSSFTIMTVNLIFVTFIFLYTLNFFLIDGEDILSKILYYLPLEDKEERMLLNKFTSVTRATLKGTAVIGLIQGTLAGLAFAVVGIKNPVFWGTIMTVLSIIPGIGTGLVWLPAALLLIFTGATANGIGLILFCAIIVGGADNILRPRLVGKDTEMPELLIFFGTIGGITLLGLVGFIVGPIIAALFITVWDIYGNVFQAYLPEVGPLVTKKESKISVKNKRRKS